MITAERLREVLHYETDTGVFTRRVRTARCIRIGDVAGGANSEGYWCIKIDCRTHKAHRLAWLYMTGEWPKDQVDHINMNKADNRWANLRAATSTQNKSNRTAYSNNLSGIKGVALVRGKWRAYLYEGGKTFHLGYFGTPGQASIAHAIAAEKQHGEFSCPKLEDVAHDIVVKERQRLTRKKVETGILQNLADLSAYAA
jgi:hypothetical protein